MPWKIALNRSARAVFAEWDQFGFLFDVCDDAVWAILNTHPGGQLRARPDFPAPADLAAGDGPAVRDAFKRATAARSAWLAISAAFCAAILDSIGESNRLAISDPETDTPTRHHQCDDCSPRDNDGCRDRGADLPAHIVLFRGHLARLTTAGQAPLDLDAYRLFLASLSPFPVFLQYTMLWTVANGAIGQQTFEANATYIRAQHTNILAHSNLRPFAGNIEGFEDGASEDEGMMGGDSIYPMSPTIIPPIPYG